MANHIGQQPFRSPRDQWVTTGVAGIERPLVGLPFHRGPGDDSLPQIHTDLLAGIRFWGFAESVVGHKPGWVGLLEDLVPDIGPGNDVLVADHAIPDIVDSALLEELHQISTQLGIPNRDLVHLPQDAMAKPDVPPVQANSVWHGKPRLVQLGQFPEHKVVDLGNRSQRKRNVVHDLRLFNTGLVLDPNPGNGHVQYRDEDEGMNEPLEHLQMTPKVPKYGKDQPHKKREPEQSSHIPVRPHD